MSRMTFSSPGVIHQYTPGLTAFEHTPSHEKAVASNKLFFIGGLGDGFFTVPYVQWLLKIEGWTIVQVMISSSYKGWGTGSVKRDAKEIASCIGYFRNMDSKQGRHGKYVLMGHSTGSQDTFQYLMDSSKGNVPKLDGAILQAPVSDREYIANRKKTAWLASIVYCEPMVKHAGEKIPNKWHPSDEIIPSMMRNGFEDTPISAERWWSLAAPLDTDGNPQGSEDFFSSDISDRILESTFGKIPTETRVLILHSGNDEFVPNHVNKELLVGRWVAICEKAGINVAKCSGVVRGASHNYEYVSEEVKNDLLERVGTFLGELVID